MDANYNSINIQSIAFLQMATKSHKVIKEVK